MSLYRYFIWLLWNLNTAVNMWKIYFERENLVNAPRYHWIWQEGIETNIPSRATIFPGWMLRYGLVDLQHNWLKCDTFLNPQKEICDVVSRFIEDNNRPEWMIIDDDPEPKPDRPDFLIRQHTYPQYLFTYTQIVMSTTAK